MPEYSAVIGISNLLIREGEVHGRRKSKVDCSNESLLSRFDFCDDFLAPQYRIIGLNDDEIDFLTTIYCNSFEIGFKEEQKKD